MQSSKRKCMNENSNIVKLLLAPLIHQLSVSKIDVTLLLCIYDLAEAEHLLSNSNWCFTSG